MRVSTDTIADFITQVLNGLAHPEPVASPVIPVTAEKMAALHELQVRSLIAASGMPPDMAERLLAYMQRYRPDLDSCQQWVQDLDTLDQRLPSINRGLIGSDHADRPPPTVHILAQWIFDGDCPITVLESTASHMKRVLEAFENTLSPGDPERDQIRGYLSSGDFSSFAMEAHLDPANTITAVAVVDRYYTKLSPGQLQGGPEPGGLTRPIDTIVRAWQNRVVPAIPNVRNRGILPRAALASVPRQGELCALTDEMRILMPSAPATEGIVPSLLPDTAIAIFRGHGLSPLLVSGRRGESIDRRLLLEMLMTVPVEVRESGTVSLPLRAIRDWIWPHGGWNQEKDWPRLENAFRSVNGVALPWEGVIDGQRQSIMYVPLTIARWPQRGDLDGCVVIQCRLPPGGERGPLIDRRRLRDYGATSVRAWRIYLHAAHHWNAHLTYNGKFLSPNVPEVLRGEGGVILDVRGDQVRDSSGRPVRNWAHPKAVPTGKLVTNPAAARYGGMRIFTGDALIEWCYPGLNVGGSKRSEYRRRVAATLTQMDRERAIRVEIIKLGKQVDGWRIFPPPDLYTRG